MLFQIRIQRRHWMMVRRVITYMIGALAGGAVFGMTMFPWLLPYILIGAMNVLTVLVVSALVYWVYRLLCPMIDVIQIVDDDDAGPRDDGQKEE